MKLHWQKIIIISLMLSLSEVSHAINLPDLGNVLSKSVSRFFSKNKAGELVRAAEKSNSEATTISKEAFTLSHDLRANLVQSSDIVGNSGLFTSIKDLCIVGACDLGYIAPSQARALSDLELYLTTPGIRGVTAIGEKGSGKSYLTTLLQSQIIKGLADPMLKDTKIFAIKASKLVELNNSSNFKTYLENLIEINMKGKSEGHFLFTIDDASVFLNKENNLNLNTYLDIIDEVTRAKAKKPSMVILESTSETQRTELTKAGGKAMESFKDVIVSQLSDFDIMEIMRQASKNLRSDYKFEFSDEVLSLIRINAKKYLGSEGHPTAEIRMLNLIANAQRQKLLGKNLIANDRLATELNTLKNRLQEATKLAQQSGGEYAKKLTRTLPSQIKRLERIVTEDANKFTEFKKQVADYNTAKESLKNLEAKTVKSSSVKSQIEQLKNDISAKEKSLLNISKEDAANIIYINTNRELEIEAILGLRGQLTLTEQFAILTERYVGQPEALKVLKDVLTRIRSISEFGKENVDPQIILLAGHPGTGKTFAPELLSEVLGKELILINGTEFSEKHAIAKLIGAPPGYVGSEQGGQLFEKLIKNPDSLILIDELARADKTFQEVLLKLLEGGTVTDSLGRTMNIKGRVVFMTDNSLEHISEDALLNMRPSEVIKNLAASGKYLEPLLDRIKVVVTTRRLDINSLSAILRLELKKINKNFNSLFINVKVSSAVIDDLAKDLFSSASSARGAKAKIDQIGGMINDMIYNGRIPEVFRERVMVGKQYVIKNVEIPRPLTDAEKLTRGDEVQVLFEGQGTKRYLTARKVKDVTEAAPTAD